jgi:hypothetical protein
MDSFDSFRDSFYYRHLPCELAGITIATGLISPHPMEEAAAVEPPKRPLAARLDVGRATIMSIERRANIGRYQS